MENQTSNKLSSDHALVNISHVNFNENISFNDNINVFKEHDYSGYLYSKFY